MAGMGSGYDLSVTTFSPDGRVFQVEYACKAVDSSATAIALACKDGVILAVEKVLVSPMVVQHTTNRRVYAIDRHIAVVVTGFLADGRQLVARARTECEIYRKYFCEAIPPKVLADRLALFMHAYTLYWSLRPFGASVLIAGVSEDETIKVRGAAGKGVNNTGYLNTFGEIYSIDPSGTCYKYAGHAIGKGRESAKTELEKLNLSELSAKDALVEVSRILLSLNEDTNSTNIIELGWITVETDCVYESVSKQMTTQATSEAKVILDRMDQE